MVENGVKCRVLKMGLRESAKENWRKRKPVQQLKKTGPAGRIATHPVHFSPPPSRAPRVTHINTPPLHTCTLTLSSRLCFPRNPEAQNTEPELRHFHDRRSRSLSTLFLSLPRHHHCCPSLPHFTLTMPAQHLTHSIPTIHEGTHRRVESRGRFGIYWSLRTPLKPIFLGS